MDISYIPMARGFVYLAAVVDWFSRKILSWKLSITMTRPVKLSQNPLEIFACEVRFVPVRRADLW